MGRRRLRVPVDAPDEQHRVPARVERGRLVERAAPDPAATTTAAA
jgi:hypothetical protein